MLRARPCRLESFLAGSLLVLLPAGLAAQPLPASPVPVAPGTPPGEAPPRGVEVLARGPVHEAYAAPATAPTPTRPVPRRPPRDLDEMPPAERPDGDAAWIGGYWAWDDDRSDFLWVSGVWRVSPPGQEWVPGYWRPEADSWQWVPGFWTAASPPEAPREIVYLPEPPVQVEAAAPGPAPEPASFYVPGHWHWAGERYAWRAGYWGRVQPGYVWVPACYHWTPRGYIYIPGYWDVVLERRGILYAPVAVDPAVVGISFVYTPSYAVSTGIFVDALFVRPSCRHYYFGDYYAASYRERGFEISFVYGQRHYDPILAYERWRHRDDPSWLDVRVRLSLDRCAGRLPPPPRTLSAQLALHHHHRPAPGRPLPPAVLVPPSRLAASGGPRLVPVDPGHRHQVREASRRLQDVGRHRGRNELPPPRGTPSRPSSVRLPGPGPSPRAPSSPARPPAGPSTGPRPPSSPARPPAGPSTGPRPPRSPGGPPTPFPSRRPQQPRATPQPGRTPGPGLPAPRPPRRP